MAQLADTPKVQAAPAPSCRSQIDNLVSVGASLIHLLERETALLIDMKTQEVGALQDEKKELVRLYALAVRQLRENAAALKAALPVVQEEIEAALNRVHDVALRNERAIASARKVNEGVMKAIAEVWNADRSAAAGYNRAGAKPQPNTKKPGFSYAAVVLDEKC
ncbi:MAG: hypothetical protein JNL71_07320 [Rhodospirillales bacterium]|nr:hypothetical protein [Rhodospirillales bacterium]